MKIIPVIHYLTPELAVQNAQIAFDAGCEGVFLIDMGGANDAVLPDMGVALKQRWPEKKIGINLLTELPIMALRYSMVHKLDMTWVDNCGIQGSMYGSMTVQMQELLRISNHQLFGGVAFKYQAKDPNPVAAVKRASEMGIIPTTSGPETGKPASVLELEPMRQALGPDKPLAVASGVTPENVQNYQGLITHALVATGISMNFHRFDPKKLNALMTSLRWPKDSHDEA